MEIKDTALLEELRSKIFNGATAVETMRFVIDRLQLGPESRLVVVAYFRSAFGLQLRDASKLGAWEFFTEGTWSEKAINDEVTPILYHSLKSK